MFCCCLATLFLVVVQLMVVCHSKREQTVNCVSVNAPEFGFADKCAEGNSCPIGTKVNFNCSHGYKLKGSDSITCGNVNLIGQKFGSWSDRIPSCILDNDHCAQLTAVSNGNISDCYSRPCSTGTEVRFSCNEGFVLRGGAAIICQKATNKSQAEWSSFQPYCNQMGSFSLEDVIYALFASFF